MGSRPLVAILTPTTTYKVGEFLAAADRLGIDVLIGTGRQQALERQAPAGTVALDFARPARAIERLRERVLSRPLRGIVGTDDETVVLAALAAEALGLPHNPPAAVRAARDKHAMRVALAAAGLDGPRFELIPLGLPPVESARRMRYPVVLKPLNLSASRGVLRADEPEDFLRAFARIAAILEGSSSSHLLVEEFRSGPELALEGLLSAGRLHPLALFDKPDALEGPTFEETIYVTPSRLPEATQAAIVAEAAAACVALRLVEGPVHAELRLHRGRPWVVEIAPRTIGGLCSRALRFEAEVSLEELVLRHALGDPSIPPRASVASGVMMMPIPRAGLLRGVRGLARARGVPGIDEVTISLRRGARLVPLPEGHRYLGFIFARGAGPETVERALREAHAELEFEIEDR
jgi:biotin carboxylase